MSKNSPLVSIAIPLFNTKDWILSMIECIQSQTYSNWELIIVDDGSTDGSYELVSSVLDNRVKVLQRDREPKGAQTCRNIALSVAKGKYLLFFDSDDLITQNCLENRVHFMEKHPEIDFGVFGCNNFLPGEDITCVQTKSGGYGRHSTNNALSEFLKTNYPFLVVTNIYRLDSLRQKEIYWDEDVKGFQDFHFNFTCLNKGLSYKFNAPFVCDYLYRVGHTSSNISSNLISQEKYDSTIKLMSKILHELKGDNYKALKNDFWGFYMNYYRMLVLSQNVLVKDYEKWCVKTYSKKYVNRMKLVKYIVKSIPVSSLNKSRIFKLFTLFLFNIKIA